MPRVSSGEEDYLGDEVVLGYLEDAHSKFVSGDKFQLMRCVYLCARFQAVIPDWAVDELVKIQESMEIGKIRDFNEAFGKPFERVDARATKARRKSLTPDVFQALAVLRLRGSQLMTSEVFFSAVQEYLKDKGIKASTRDIQGIYNENKAFILSLPIGDDPKRNFASGFASFPRPRRRGRPTF